MIAITLGGQLALLMLVERLEQAGIPVISGNTDGIVVRCPKKLAGVVENSRLLEGKLKGIIEQWEADTGFELEATEYSALYSANVNRYIAIKPDGNAKRKGIGLVSPRALGEEDLRTQLMTSPNMAICSNAVVAHIVNGVPLEDTIRAGTDVRDFVTVINVKGGSTWRGDYQGKVVRYYWSTDGDGIFYKSPHPKTGNHKQVSNTDGARPLMEMPNDFILPADIDYTRYVETARGLLMDIGQIHRPAPIKPIKLFKYNAIAWFALAAA